MSDEFVRKRSQRWVNSVPTYGDYEDDDWYEYEGNDYEHQSQEQQKKLTPQRFELPSDHAPPLPTVDISEYQNQDQGNYVANTTTSNADAASTVPHSDHPADNLVLSNDNEHLAGEYSSDKESPQDQSEIHSYYQPEQINREEVVHASEDQHPFSPMGQPGLRLSIYKKDIRSSEEEFDESPENYQEEDYQEEDYDETGSIGNEADFKSVNPSTITRKAPTNEVANDEPIHPPPNLVLSVDNRNIYSDSSDDDDDDDMNDSDDIRSEVGFNETVDNFQKSSSKSTSNTPTIDTRNNKSISYNQESSNQNYEPPTPTYSDSNHGSVPPQSPSVASETSFNSEYSYQKEPASLRVANYQEVIESRYGHQQTHQQEEEGEEKDKDESLVDPVASNNLEPIETITNQEQPGLVLSVDQQKIDSSDDDDDDEDDDWGYNSQNSSNEDIGNDGLNVPQDSHAEIDSFINELNNSSGGNKSGEILPPLDHDVSLPDFQNTSFSKYDEEQPLNRKEQSVSNNYQESGDGDGDDDEYILPIKPLSISEQQEAHDDYLSTLSGRRQSVRKAPKHSMVFSDDFRENESGHMEEVKEHENEEIISTEVPEDSTSIHLDEPKDDNDSRKASLELYPPELHPVHSSGSLSTGRLSMDTTSQKAPNGSDEFLPKDVRDSRRISTSSNATFNLGGWTPNTDRFRNQFINENDSESISYNPERSTYDSFTKIRNTNSSLAEEISNSSSLSVPETIDAGMPSIQENPTSEDEDVSEASNNEEPEGVQGFYGDRVSVNHTMTLSSFNDSVLNDYNYQKPLFREERLTPAASEDDISTQKYHSLIPPDIRVPSDSSETTERKRSVSTSTVKTDATVNITPKITSPPPSSSPPLTTPGKYPVSDWKSIITISQPQDRIAAFKQALLKEQEYDSGIQSWLNYALKQEPSFNSNLSIGRVASQAYQNAPHNDLRRHASLRTKVNLVKDKVEGTTGSFGKTTGSLGKKLFSRSKKFIKSTTGDN